MLVIPLGDVEKADMTGMSWREKAMIPLLQEHAAQLTWKAQNVETLTRRVTMTIDQSLGRKRITLGWVADVLGMSVRTLQRKLDEEGTSFRQIMSVERRRMAESVLRHRQRGRVLTAAIRTGYSDASALSRAYKRWTGDSPNRLAINVEGSDVPSD
jgi:AraC-like DNA-binding protein